MKKITGIAFGVALTTLACTEKKVEKEVVDTKPSIPTIRENGLKIAFYNQDSLKNGFDFYKQMDNLVKNKQISFQKQLEKKQMDLQSYLVTNDELAKRGQLSDLQMQNIQAEAQKKEQEIYVFQQNQGGAIEKQTVELMDKIYKKIEAASKKYCELHHIDMLLVQASGSQFNYINPTMDVTKEFIGFLNQEHEKSKK
jgi:Skp family chaperone for outer membrane proteins